MDNTYNIDFIARCIAGHNKTDIKSIIAKLKEHSDALTEVDTALSGKQDTLSAEQLSAVNSGITSTDVAQIETNKNNISLLDSKVGVKNILGITLSGLKAVNSGTWTGRAIVINGVTFTYNIDGTITADGTAGSGGANLYLYRHRNVADYDYLGATLTGCPSGGGAETYGIFIEQESSPYGTFGADTGSGVTIADKANRDSYGMITVKGTVSNITFSPMITHSSDLTFEAYSPTNRELYNDILTLQS